MAAFSRSKARSAAVVGRGVGVVDILIGSVLVVVNVCGYWVYVGIVVVAVELCF